MNQEELKEGIGRYTALGPTGDSIESSINTIPETSPVIAQILTSKKLNF